MTTIKQNIDNMIRTNMLYRFNCELQVSEDKDRRQVITHIIEKINNNINENICVKDKRERMFKQIDIDVYKQKWSRLQQFHKENRINKYIDSKYTNHKDKEILRKKLLENLNNNIYKTEKFVKYDIKNACIIDIINYIEKDGEFIFDIIKQKNKN